MEKYSDRTLGEWALLYASLGMAVIPLHSRSKTPATEHGCKDATTDPTQIRTWWTECPDYNIGIATGEASGGLIVIDLDKDPDKGKDGVGSLIEWMEQNGKFPKTCVSKTGRDGRHLYFRDDAIWHNSANANTGIDVRAQGGYVVAPPSIAANNNRYEWINEIGDVEIAVANEAVRDFLRGQKKQTQKKLNVSEDADIHLGERNDTLFRLASSLQAKGLSDEAIRAAVETENETRCSEPLGTKEVNSLLNSVLTRYTKGTASYELGPADGDALTEGQSLRPDEFTDLQEASKFTEFYGAELRSNSATGFLVYDGVRWIESEERARLKVHEFVRRQELEADHLIQMAAERKRQLLKELDGRQVKEGSEEAKRSEDIRNALADATDYLSKALGYQNSTRMDAILREAAPKVHIEIEELDADGYLLNTPAGVIDLRTGKIREHNPKDYLTKVTKCSPSDEGTDEWKKFLEQVTSGDAELEEYLQYCFGMGIIGEVRQEKLLIAYGSGGNGKSTLCNAVSTVLGDYSGVLPAEVLTMNNRKNPGPQYAELRGRRLVLASELAEGMRLNTAVVKQLCSTDSVSAERKYKDPFYFRPSHSVILSTNHLPTVGTVDNGTWSRLVVIPFIGVFRNTTGEILNYAAELADRCGGAILKWTIEGAVKFIRAGFKLVEPQAVTDAVAEYRDDNNWLEAFLSECCEIGKAYKVGAAALQERFSSYCEKTGERRKSPADFKAAIRNAGYEPVKINTGTFYHGLRLKPDEEQKCVESLLMLNE